MKESCKLAFVFGMPYIVKSWIMFMEALGMNKNALIVMPYFIFLYYSYVDQSVPQSIQNLTAFKVGFGI